MYWRFNSLPQILNDFNNLLNSFEGERRYEKGFDQFPVNFWRGKDGAILLAKIAGIDPKNIDISVVGQTLTIEGKFDQTDKGDIKFHKKERSYGEFSKTFELPFRVEAEKVEANFKNGLLEIKLPQAESDKPKTISVKSL